MLALQVRLGSAYTARYDGIAHEIGERCDILLAAVETVSQLGEGLNLFSANIKSYERNHIDMIQSATKKGDHLWRIDMAIVYR